MSKISLLTPAGPLDGSEQVVLVQGGATRRGPISNLVDAAVAPHVTDAVSAADRAELNAELALTASQMLPNVVPNEEAGVAAVAEGGYFFTETLGFFRKVAGSAVFKAMLVTASVLGIAMPELANAAGDGETDDTAALVETNTRQKITVINRTHYVAGNLTLDCVRFGPFGKIKTGPAANVVIGELFKSYRNRRIFDDSEGGTISLLQNVARPDWWGDIEESITKAIYSLPAGPGTVLLEAKTYKQQNHSYASTTAASRFMDRDNITVIGAGSPRPNSTCTALEGGTVIQGFFLVYASKTKWRGFGIDVGYDFCEAHNGGVALDAFMATFASQELKDSNAWRYDIDIDDVVALCRDPTSEIHAMILGEGISAPRVGRTESWYGFHGQVIKAPYAIVGTMVCHMHGGEAFIGKTDDQSSAVFNDAVIDTIIADRNGPEGTTPHTACTSGVGVMINPAGGNIGRVQIGKIIVKGGYPIGITMLFGPANKLIESLTIADALLDDNPVAAVTMLGGAGSKITNSGIARLQTRSTPVGWIGSVGMLSTFQIGYHKAVNCGVAAESNGFPAYIVDVLEVENPTDAACRFYGTARPSVGKLIVIGGTGQKFSTANGLIGFFKGEAPSPGQAPTLNVGWSNLENAGAAVDPFDIDFVGHEIVVNGLVEPGVGATISVANFPFWCKPSKVIRGGGLQGSAPVEAPPGTFTPTLHSVPWLADNDSGNLFINELTNNTANCSTYLSLQGARWRL